jgi:hypothetical protein
MKVAVIGSEGYLGQRLANYIEKDLIALVRISHKYMESSNTERIPFTISNPYLPAPVDFTHIIYLSWLTSRSESAQRKSYEAARYVAEWAKANKKNALFISTMSSRSEVPSSNYGFWKKQAEFEFSKFGFNVVRPGTIITETDFQGSALEALKKSSFMMNFGLRLLAPIRVPIVSEEMFITHLIQSISRKNTATTEDLFSDTTSIQQILGIQSGCLQLKVLKSLLRIIPVDTADKIRTLLDLNIVNQSHSN